MIQSYSFDSSNLSYGSKLPQDLHRQPYSTRRESIPSPGGLPRSTSERARVRASLTSTSHYPLRTVFTPPSSHDFAFCLVSRRHQNSSSPNQRANSEKETAN